MRFAVAKAGRTPPKVTAWSVLQHSEPHQMSCPAHPAETHEGVWLKREVGTKPCRRWPPHLQGTCHLQTEGPGPGSRTQASRLRSLRLLTGAEANTAGLFGEYAILKLGFISGAHSHLLHNPDWTAFHNHTRRQALFLSNEVAVKGAFEFQSTAAHLFGARVLDSLGIFGHGTLRMG